MLRVIDIGAAVLLAAGVLFTFGDALLAMVNQWDVSPMYSYAYTVPAISAFLLWSRRDEFRRRPMRPARLAAVPVLGLSLLLLVLGHVGAIQVVQQFAFLVAIVGIVLFLFGVDYLIVGAPALGYLLFMIPFWDAFTERLHWPFQNNSARLGVALMHAIGVPAYREGTFIALPNVLLEVAKACSGVNYLVAVLALALPLSFLQLDSLWRRLVLIGSAMAIAAFANALRVALIGTLAYYEIGSPLHGPFHVLHGLFVAGVGYVVLFAGLHLLQSPQAPAEGAPGAGATDAWTRWRTADAYGLAVAFWTLAFIGVAPQATPVVLARPLDSLPVRLAEWSADPSTNRLRPAYGSDASDPILSVWSDADQRLRRRYRGPGGQEATVDVLYFETQRQSREMVNFKSADLHRRAVPGAIRLPDGGDFTVNIVHWPDRQEVGLFWYDLGGSAESNQYAAKFLSVWHVLSAGRNNGAAIVVRARVGVRSESATLEAIQGLAASLQPALVAVWAPRAGAPAAPVESK